MTREFLATLTRRYHAYVDTFRAADGSLPQMLQLKLDHTLQVVEDAKRIMAGEAWSESASVSGEACALLHDVGRYSQLKEFGTFQDAKSIDHAVRGVEVIEAQRLLRGLAQAERKRILTSVALHNKKRVPMTLETATASRVHVVRDADKLDIFRVLEVAVEDGSLERNPEIAWELQVKGSPSPAIVEAVRQGHPVSYAWVKTLSDFVLIQVGWLIGGLYYPATLRLASERRVLEYREAFLKTLSDDPGVDVCCEAARAFLNEQLNLPVKT
ncbi:MAG: HD domain-containing protein [bacterium]